ncbi:hypothetical protein PVAP13_2NG084746 [Panicum virgatum]|uniref:NB-ARC domain-containing protein n=1 Tax=Panicum virgatum TaxID=38727 RepID=A0A8T0VC69_PANVG|nr:hypothetical protein PVAP13_2NG084746 [Panicum virgatum]
MAAHEERDENKVVKTWVKQVRNVAYDVEDYDNVIVGSTGDNEKSCPSRTGFFQPAIFEKLDDWTIKSSPKELKFWGDEDDDFENTSPKDFDKSPHGLRGIERNRSKNGVFSGTQKLRFVETRDSGGCSTRLDGLGSLQGVTKSSRSSPSSRCLQDLAIRLGKPSQWCILRMLVDRRKVATRMKELRAKVEGVSQRNIRYRLIKGTGPKPATGAGPSSISVATMFGIEEARRQKDKVKVDLSQLINEGDKDLRVIYDNLKRSEKFELYAWIRIVHPFSPLEFLQCIMSQFYRTSFEKAGKVQEETNIGTQVLKKMAVMKQDDLVDAFSKHVNKKSYLIVLNDLSTIEEWDVIKEYFPNKKKGSRIIVSTEHGEVASLCAGQESVVSELKQSSVDQSIFASYNKVLQSQTTLMKLGSGSIVVTHGASNIAMPTIEILQNQFVGNNEKMVRKSLTRIGTISCALVESQLVGREKEKSDLINLISKQDNQQCTVISVWGMGGLGKTTLVKEVYQSQELSGLFEKRACITVMRPFVLEKVLESLFMQLDEKSSNRAGTRNVKEALCKLLERKRCLIVLDDLSSAAEWDTIIQSLPKMENASKIVITTREENIAKHCSPKQKDIYKLEVLDNRGALDLFTKKVFKEAIDLNEHPALIEEARTILKKCNGLPLAIVTICGFLAKQPKTPMEWRKLNEHISAELQMNPELGIIKTILMKSYDGLPYHLKSCFLYLSVFPEDYNITRRRLVHRWSAEGYSSEVRGKSMGDVADSYFMELIDRSMILPIKEPNSSGKGISSCKLHDLKREISISKAIEENLVFRMEEGCSINTQGTIRHLAISSNWEGDQSEFESTVDLSRIRSLTVFGKWKPFYVSDKMRLLRVLDLESTTGLVDHHLKSIGKLVHLKYLSLRSCRGIFHLPDSLGNLKQLQALDITDTFINKLPQAIIKLRKLQYIRASKYNPRGAAICELRRMSPLGAPVRMWHRCLEEARSPHGPLGALPNRASLLPILESFTL